MNDLFPQLAILIHADGTFHAVYEEHPSNGAGWDRSKTAVNGSKIFFDAYRVQGSELVFPGIGTARPSSEDPRTMILHMEADIQSPGLKGSDLEMPLTITYPSPIPALELCLFRFRS